VNAGTMKLQAVTPIQPGAIPAADPERKILEGKDKGETDPAGISQAENDKVGNVSVRHRGVGLR
jgi:hypothetical protein